MIRGVFAVPGALIRPDRAFAGRDVYQLSATILILALFLCHIVGGRLVQGYFQNAHAKTLAIAEADARMSGLLANAPPEVQTRARTQMLSSILGKGSSVITSFGIVVSGVEFVALCAELWLVSLVAAQFFGGQEERHGKPRASWILFLVAFIPLALRSLLTGVLMTLGNASAQNAITLEDYRRLSIPSLDLYSILHGGLPWPFAAALARFLTDPFFLWSFAILVAGGRSVFRIPLRGAIWLVAVLVVVLSLQTALLARIGVTWEI